MNNLNDIINECNCDITLLLFDNEFKISAERNIYTWLRKKYTILADSFYTRYLEADNEFKKLDDLIEKSNVKFYSLLNEAAQEVVNDALSIGINTLDVNNVVKEYKSGWYLDSFKKAYNEFYEPYQDAMKLLQDRKDTRYAVDVAFGDGGDFMERAMYNAVDKAQAKSIFKDLFRNTSLRNDLKSSIWFGFFNLHFYIIDYFPKKGNVKLGGFVTSAASKNAEGIFNNIQNQNVSIEQKKDFTVKILENNPFIGKYYATFTMLFPENTYEFVKLAEYFGVNNYIALIVKQLVEFTKNNLGTTESNAEDCRYMLNQKIAEYGLSPESAAAAFAVIDDRCAVLDVEYRTVEGMIFETRDEADSARADIENNKVMLEKSCSDFIYRNDYVSHINAIENLPIPQPIRDVYAARYQIQLNEFDKSCKLAELYEQKHSGEKRSFKSFVSSAITSSDKQKQAWETITHSGQYKLSDIIAGAPVSEGTSDLFGTVANVGNAAVDKAKSAAEKFGGLFSKRK